MIEAQVVTYSAAYTEETTIFACARNALYKCATVWMYDTANRGGHRGRTLRCVRAVQKVGHFPPPVANFWGV